MFEKTIILSPAFDGQDSDRGIHGVDLKFVLKGPLGATQFVLFTNWFLPGIDTKLMKPIPAVLGYHSPTPLFEGQTHNESCNILGDDGCYNNGSVLQAEPVFDTLRKEGSEGVWHILEEKYNLHFKKVEKCPKGKNNE